MGLFQARSHSHSQKITRRLPLAACVSCDMLLKDIDVPDSHSVRCPRCGAVMFHNQRHSLEREYALVIAGLLLFFPAILLPLVTISPVGLHIETNMVEGVWILFEQGHPMVAALVLFCAIVIPFLKFLTLFFVLSAIGMGRFKKPAINSFIWFRRLDEWGMLEVYMLGVLLCINNLDGMSIDMNPVPGVGFWTFVGVMFIAVISSVSLNVQYVWERLEEL